MAQFNRDTMQPVQPDLIPGTSWGSSLANLLTKQSWDAIRLPVIRRQGNVCQICGARPGPLECHEIWAYAMPPKDLIVADGESPFGVQRLIGLASLCKAHHAMFHMGFARMSGTYEAVKARLIAVNRWSTVDYATFEAKQGKRFMARSAVGWALDVSLVADYPPLMIKPGWTRDEQGLLRRPAGAGGQDAITLILGVDYRLGSDLVTAIDPTEAKDGLMPEEGDFDFVWSMGNGVNDKIETVPPKVTVPVDGALAHARRVASAIQDQVAVAQSKRVQPIEEQSGGSGLTMRTFSGGNARADLDELLSQGSVPPRHSPRDPKPAPVWTSSVPSPPEPKPVGWFKRLFGGQ